MLLQPHKSTAPVAAAITAFLLLATAPFVLAQESEDEVLVAPEDAAVEPIEVCEEPLFSAEVDSTADVPPCVACTGCGFGSKAINGRTHNLNFEPRVWNARAGVCEVVGGECWPNPDKPCRGTVKVVVPIFPGEEVVESARGRCVANGGRETKSKTWTYTYEGPCGTFGSVTFRWYSRAPGRGCDGLGDQVDEAKAVLFCNFCS